METLFDWECGDEDRERERRRIVDADGSFRLKSGRDVKDAMMRREANSGEQSEILIRMTRPHNVYGCV